MFNPVDKRAYLPLPCPGIPPGTLYMAVEYEVSHGRFLIKTPRHGLTAWS